MPLPLREKLTLLMPPSLFYRRRIAEEARSGEPELAILDELVPRGGVALDIGANQGIFAYASRRLPKGSSPSSQTPTTRSSRAGCCAAVSKS